MIHKALKLLRSYHNVKQKDLAEKLSISQSHLSEIEKGIKPVNYQLLEQYSKLFDIPVSAIAFFSEIELADKQGRGSFPVKVTGKALKMLEWFDSIRSFHDEDAERHASKAS